MALDDTLDDALMTLETNKTLDDATRHLRTLDITLMTLDGAPMTLDDALDSRSRRRCRCTRPPACLTS